MDTQQDIHNAFLWVCRTYTEGRALLEDAVRLFEDVGLSAWDTRFSTAYSQVLHTADLPFIWLACQFFSPSPEDDTTGKAAFIGVDFHSAHRVGPALLGGFVHYANSARVDHWLINVTARLPGQDGRFKVTQAGPNTVSIHTPTEKGKRIHAGIVAVRHVEVPLTKIDNQERLASFVQALRAMRDGDEKPVTELLKDLSGAGGP